MVTALYIGRCAHHARCFATCATEMPACSKLRTALGIGAGLGSMMTWQALQPHAFEEPPYHPTIAFGIGGLGFRFVAPNPGIPGIVCGLTVMAIGSATWGAYLSVRQSLHIFETSSQLSEDEILRLQRDLSKWKITSSAGSLDERGFERIADTAKTAFIGLAETDPRTGELCIFRRRLEQDAAANDLVGDGQLLLVVQIFSIMDLNHDGKISWDEFWTGWLLIQASQVADHRLQKSLWFRALDLDHNGSISRSELVHWVKVLMRLGGISAADAVVHQGFFKKSRPATPEEIVEKWLQAYDVNRDGTISQTEFEAMVSEIDFSPLACGHDQILHFLKSSVGTFFERSKKAQVNDIRWYVELQRLPALVPCHVQATMITETRPEDTDASGSDHSIAAMSHKIAGAILPVVNFVQQIGERVSPEEVPQALLGLPKLIKNDPFSKDEQTTAPISRELAELFDDALRYMRMCTAAYGAALVNPATYPKDHISISQMFDQRVLVSVHTGMDETTASVVHMHPQSTWLHPAYFILHDKKRQEAVVVIRGTCSLEDVITDIGATAVDFWLGGKAHQNFLHCACNVLLSATPYLEDLSAEIDTVTFTGHSMGGSVAVYLSLLFRELITDKAEVSIRCHTFGAAPTCSLSLAQSLHDQVCGFCHNEDIVPRLSYGHGLELFARALEASGSAPLHDLNEDNFKLYPAGRSFFILDDGTVAEVGPKNLAPKISMGGATRMISDHFPWAYEKSLEAACAT